MWHEVLGCLYLSFAVLHSNVLFSDKFIQSVVVLPVVGEGRGGEGKGGEGRRGEERGGGSLSERIKHLFRGKHAQTAGQMNGQTNIQMGSRHRQQQHRLTHTLLSHTHTNILLL